jgi:hypothetical protein
MSTIRRRTGGPLILRDTPDIGLTVRLQRDLAPAIRPGPWQDAPRPRYASADGDQRIVQETPDYGLRVQMRKLAATGSPAPLDWLLVAVRVSATEVYPLHVRVCVVAPVALAPVSECEPSSQLVELSDSSDVATYVELIRVDLAALWALAPGSVKIEIYAYLEPPPEVEEPYWGYDVINSELAQITAVAGRGTPTPYDLGQEFWWDPWESETSQALAFAQTYDEPTFVYTLGIQDSDGDWIADHVTPVCDRRGPLLCTIDINPADQSIKIMDAPPPVYWLG